MRAPRLGTVAHRRSRLPGRSWWGLSGIFASRANPHTRMYTRGGSGVSTPSAAGRTSRAARRDRWLVDAHGRCHHDVRHGGASSFPASMRRPTCRSCAPHRRGPCTAVSCKPGGPTERSAKERPAACQRPGDGRAREELPGELILVDDGSTDRSPELMAELAAQHCSCGRSATCTTAGIAAA